MNEKLQIAFGLLGGLAIFIYGMNMMSECLQKAAGEKMKSIRNSTSEDQMAFYSAESDPEIHPTKDSDVQNYLFVLLSAFSPAFSIQPDFLNFSFPTFSSIFTQVFPKCSCCCRQIFLISAFLFCGMPDFDPDIYSYMYYMPF